MAKADQLTPQQQKFCREYLKDFNAYRAAKSVGYSESYAKVNVYRLLEKASVQTFLSTLIGKAIDEEDITPEEVIRGYVRIARADMRHYMSWGPEGTHVFPSDTLSDAQAYAISEVSETVTTYPGGREQRQVRFKLESKAHAQDALSKYFDLWKEGEKAKAIAEAFGQGMVGLLKAREHAESQSAD